MKADLGKERERSTRRLKPGGKHSKGKPKKTKVKKVGGPSRDYGREESRMRHRRGPSHRNSGSTSSSPDEEETVLDHRAVLAAKSRLTSPSMVSIFTTQTTATNKSHSSSGSNSTITQASVTRRAAVEKKPEVKEAGEQPTSSSMPESPNVSQSLEDGNPPKAEAGDDEDEEDDDDESEDEEETPQWQPKRTEGEGAYVESAPPHQQHISTSSSASSSFHEEDSFSEPAADNETDRSSSPERTAAQQRQHTHVSMQQLGNPSMPRGNVPRISTSNLSSRSQHQAQMQYRPLPRVERLPATGYELLASMLSEFSASESGPRIKPIYRKFSALNHRLLLHLQDELSELEEQLRQLDHADTQARVVDIHGHIVPASRRLAAQAGGELQWHKTDILGRIGYKLEQYNHVLSSFKSTQSLAHPDPEDIELYRAYLQTEQPIAEPETHFLDPADDLVSITSDPPHSFASPSLTSSLSSRSLPSSSPGSPLLQTRQPSMDLQPVLPGVASALAIAVLVPILMFSVIPGFVGRVTVAALVGVFMVGALVQSGIVDRGWMVKREGFSCVGCYLGVMVVLAGVV
ncbi:uncharacterized protein L3040_003574 [Drepanopeziza brunnea f. sp. 'multigermtubi']|uniref:uncharacterized protein n=1 Tax=Drepanopeziza brunnea f. sp. 'multigermtubi' TaxID=698441 RepID=UPI0023A0067E|nr:hypothetical protein L3040_003574 [Drepanopeziza brunnea f. sp. 'multigermtubi']